MRPILIRRSPSEPSQLELVGAVEGHLVRVLKALAGDLTTLGGLGMIILEKGGRSFVESLQATCERFLRRVNQTCEAAVDVGKRILTGLSSGRLVRGSPVSSSIPSTLGGL